MAREFARLGILPTLLFIAQGANAVAVGEFLNDEKLANPAAASDMRGDRFELYESLDLRDISIGDDGRDRQRIETDLLIIPGRFLKLTGSGSIPGRAGKVVRKPDRRETRIAVHPQAFDLPGVC